VSLPLCFPNLNVGAEFLGGSERLLFVFGFEKNERANISKKELEALQNIATDLLRLNSNQIDAHVDNEALQEICHDDEN